MISINCVKYSSVAKLAFISISMQMNRMVLVTRMTGVGLIPTLRYFLLFLCRNDLQCFLLTLFILNIFYSQQYNNISLCLCSFCREYNCDSEPLLQVIGTDFVFYFYWIAQIASLPVISRNQSLLSCGRGICFFCSLSLKTKNQ